MTLHLPSFLVLIVIAVSVTGSCPQGWQTFKGNCYFFNTAKIFWIVARKHCVSLGAHLARVETVDENMFLNKAYSNKSDQMGGSLVAKSRLKRDKILVYIWIDGTDVHKERTWIWSSTSEPIVYKNWHKGQPDNRFGKQHYMALGPSGQWDDGNGDHPSESICEIDARDKKEQHSCPCTNILLEELVKCRKNQ